MSNNFPFYEKDLSVVKSESLDEWYVRAINLVEDVSTFGTGIENGGIYEPVKLSSRGVDVKCKKGVITLRYSEVGFIWNEVFWHEIWSFNTLHEFEYATHLRWLNGNVVCPYCNNTKVSMIHRLTGFYKYQCNTKGCRKQFNPHTKTVFQNAKKAIFLFAIINDVIEGKSTPYSADMWEITQASAWKMHSKLKPILLADDNKWKCQPELLRLLLTNPDTYDLYN